MEKLDLQGIIKNITGSVSDFCRNFDWKQLWKKDWIVKVISICLATMLWYYVGGEEKVDKSVMIPVEIINMPRDLVISNQFKKEVEVTVSGPRSAIQEMSDKKSIAWQINMADALEGTNVVENDTDSIDVPREITVLRVQPSSIILSVDKLIQKQFQVIPVTAGDAMSGYTLKSLKMEPDVISITGPKSTLGQIDELLTKLIDLTGMKESAQIQVPLELKSSIVKLIGETTVTANITIEPQMEMRRLYNVPVTIEDEGISGRPDPDDVDIVANFPVLLIDEISDLKTAVKVTAVPSVNVGELNVKVAPRADLKLPIEILSIVPDTLKLMPGSKQTADIPDMTVEKSIQQTQARQEAVQTDGIGGVVESLPKDTGVPESFERSEEETILRIYPGKTKIYR